MNKTLYILFTALFILVSFNKSLNANEMFPGENDNIKSEQKVDTNTLITNDYLEDTAIAYGSIWFTRFFYVRNKNSRIFDTSFSDWIDNITKWPVADDGDSIFTNYIVHPAIGSFYYMYYRENGYDFWQSAAGSLLLSTLFEYTVEGLVETPSLVDLIATPGIGVPVGVVAENVSDWLESKDSLPLKVASRLVNPFKNVVKDGKLAVFNPVSGTFQFTTKFQTDLPPAKNLSLNLGYPLFFEPAIPRGFVSAFIEVADVDPDIGGQFIFYHIKGEFPSKSNLYSVYLRISQAGVNEVEINGTEVRDGFEFANALIGSKFILKKSKESVLTAGFEMIIPTAFKDNVKRLETLLLHTREFPIYLRNSLTSTPYLSYARWNGNFSLQGNLGTDLILNADRFEGDFVEWRIKYSLAMGYNFRVDYRPTLFVEFDGITLATANRVQGTDLFITPGIRFGNRVSPGFAIIVPIKGETASISDASYVFDVKIRF